MVLGQAADVDTSPGNLEEIPLPRPPESGTLGEGPEICSNKPSG